MTKKIVYYFLSIALFALMTMPSFAEVYWVDESGQSSNQYPNMIFYSPFGNPPMTWMPEFSTPMMSPTLTVPYQYPRNLWYQQFYSYPGYKLNQKRYGRNHGYGNYYQNYSPTPYGMHQYGQGYGEYNWQNQTNKQDYGNSEKKSNNNEIYQNQYGMPPGYYQPYYYAQPRTWDYYQKVYEQWAKENKSKLEENPTMQDPDYQKWLEEHGAWISQENKSNDEQVSGKDEQIKENKKGEDENSDEKLKEGQDNKDGKK